MLFLLSPQFVRAGFFSNFLKFLTGNSEAAQESSLAAVSMPLLGSQAAVAPPAVGGPIDTFGPSLSVTQDNALVAARNPNGTLASPAQDQILVYKVQSAANGFAQAELNFWGLGVFGYPLNKPIYIIP